MNDYISRQAVRELISDLKNFYEEERKTADDYGFEMSRVGSLNALTAMEDGLSDIPAADVRPVVYGEWRDYDGNPAEWSEDLENCPVGESFCSNCGHLLDGSDEYAVEGLYCPHCGADMTGGSTRRENVNNNNQQ